MSFPCSHHVVRSCHIFPYANNMVCLLGNSWILLDWLYFFSLPHFVLSKLQRGKCWKGSESLGFYILPLVAILSVICLFALLYIWQIEEATFFLGVGGLVAFYTQTIPYWIINPQQQQKKHQKTVSAWLQPCNRYRIYSLVMSIKVDKVEALSNRTRACSRASLQSPIILETDKEVGAQKPRARHNRKWDWKCQEWLLTLSRLQKWWSIDCRF